jgi:type I restriction enzyme M protein
MSVPEQRTTLDVSALESWLWEAACVVRGPLDAPKFKDYILPLVFLKRLSDVFDDEIRHLAHDFGDEKRALKLVERDHKLVRFFLPPMGRLQIIGRQRGPGAVLPRPSLGPEHVDPGANGALRAAR